MVRFKYIMEKDPALPEKGAGGPNRGKRPPLKVLTEKGEASLLPSDRSEKSMPGMQARSDLYDTAFDYLSHVLNAVEKNEHFSPDDGFEIASEMARTDYPEDPLFIRAIHEDQLEDYPIYHCVNTAVFSIHLARKLGRNEADIRRAGLLGLLHDVGSARISDPLLYKETQLTPDEIEAMQHRPSYSHEILSSLDSSWRWLAEAALAVHERSDGTGYPNGLTRDGIPDVSQIVGLVSLYDALIHSRPYGEKFLFFPAMKWIIKNEKSGFGREHLKGLLSLFTFFPLQSWVRLNTRAVGRVVETFGTQPMRPRVRIIFDAGGKRVHTERIIDMREHPLLHLLYSVSESEVLQYPGESRNG